VSKLGKPRIFILSTLVILVAIVSGLIILFPRLDDENPLAKKLSQVLVNVGKTSTAEEEPEFIKWDAMDYGPFFCSSLGGSKNPVSKAISIRIGEQSEAAVCFDTELLRMRVGWTGAFLRLPRFRDGLSGEPSPGGAIAFETKLQPGFYSNHNTNFSRSEFREERYGALPREVGRYRGQYTHGHRTILSYSVGTSSVLEMPWFTNSNGAQVFSRTIQIDQASAPLTFRLCHVANSQASFVRGLPVLLHEEPTNATFTVAKVLGIAKEFEWTMLGDGIELTLPAFTGTKTFTVLICSGPKSKLNDSVAHLPSVVENRQLETLCHGGPLLWKETISTRGKPGSKKGAYQLDSITLPEENPWRSWIRPSGFDFFPDGRIALCSVSGDVWVASGIDAKLERVTWKRYATGLFQPLGLKIIRNEIYVICRDALIRLQDLNGDGEADFYEHFNSEISNSRHFHEFCLDLQADAEGNFYTFKGSNLSGAATEQQGTLLKILADGSKMEIVATGFRAPNGVCVNPNGEIFGTDNEGDWIPACKINHIEKKGFYGFIGTAHSTTVQKTFEPPVCWVPHVADNSSGAPIWVNSTQWGPLNNTLLHTSYGTCSLFQVMTEKVNGIWQGGTVRFPLKFDSGIMRGRFSPSDGQLYLCGLTGWQNNATKDGGFYRVRFTGEPANMPNGLHIHSREIEIRFTDPLEIATASDPENFSVEQWNYNWTSDYGSKEFSVKSPAVEGRDSVKVTGVKVSADQRSLFLSIPDLKPVMQMKIEFNINAADGSTMHQEIYNTINAVPSDDSAKK
jgi:hypothetical protein